MYGRKLQIQLFTGHLLCMFTDFRGKEGSALWWQKKYQVASKILKFTQSNTKTRKNAETCNALRHKKQKQNTIAKGDGHMQNSCKSCVELNTVKLIMNLRPSSFKLKIISFVRHKCLRTSKSQPNCSRIKWMKYWLLRETEHIHHFPEYRLHDSLVVLSKWRKGRG